MKNKGSENTPSIGLLGKLSIKKKLVIIIMLVSSVGLLLAGGSFIIYEWFSLRKHMINDLNADSKMIADNCIGSLSFDDPQDAEEVLGSLQYNHPIEYACVYRSDGALFASYKREDINTVLSSEPQQDGYRFENGRLIMFKQITLNNKLIGTLYLQSDLSIISNFLKQSARALAIMIFMSSFIAYLLASRLQKVVSIPIFYLAKIASIVTQKGDYSVRAIKHSKDELGVLTDAFNNMLIQVEKREISLRESEEKYRYLFEAAGDAIFIAKATEEGKPIIIDCNEHTLDIFGCSREEIIGKSVEDFSPSVQTDGRLSHEVIFETAKAALNGKPQFAEFTHRKLDGTLFDTEITINRLDIEKEPYLQAIVRDVTERKKAEEELERYRIHLEDLVKERTGELEKANEKLKELDRLKSMFIASMSHELRTPLNSIIGFTGIILQGLVGHINEEQRDQLQRVYASAKHLLELITDVIDISRIEAGKVEAYAEEFQLDEIIKQAVLNVKTQIDDKGLGLEISVSQGIQMNTDRRRLLQCILNYLSNAVKFTEKGEITIAAAENGDKIEIKVKDTGIGIREEEMSRLFKSFVRLDSHLTTVTPGTGLGLYLTKKLATEVLSGSVSAESVYEKGSTFILKIPKRI
ncbi:MAG: ATP-binding protein [Candidatus Scalindua sp.]